jgi:hypothetical protein
MTIRSVLSSASTTNFLNIRFKRFRHVKMNDTIKMFEIKSHSQGGCRYDNFNVFVFELGNNSGFFFVLESPMKDSGSYVAVAQKIPYVVKNVFRSAVNQHSLTFHDLSCV